MTKYFFFFGLLEDENKSCVRWCYPTTFAKNLILGRTVTVPLLLWSVWHRCEWPIYPVPSISERRTPDAGRTGRHVESSTLQVAGR